MEKEFEVRDMRIKEKFFVDDEYLNGYAKLCGISATGVYFVLCRHADKKQECFPSKKLIAEKLGITERTVYSAIKILEEWRIIERREQGRKSNGSFKKHIYILLDKKKWKTKPQANITVGKKRHYPSANNDTTRRQSFPNKDTQVKDTHIENIAETSSAEFSSKDYVESLLKDKKRHLNIIGKYFIACNILFPSLKAGQDEIRRWVKDASILAEYTDEQITKSYNYVVKEFPEQWNLSTIKKYINKHN